MKFIYDLLKFLFTIALLLSFTNYNIAQNSKWVLTMTKESGYNGQEWITKTIFPDPEIKELWEKEYKITNLTYGEGKWAVVMSKGSGFGQQELIIKEYFPQNEIEKLTQAGLEITGLAFGQNKWVIVMSAGSMYKNQFVIYKPEFPEYEIQNFFDDGYTISSLVYGQKKWIIIFSKGSKYKAQNLLNTSLFPENKISEFWKSGRKITGYTFSNEKWGVVMSSETEFGLQAIIIKGYYPKKDINQLWDKGYRITNLEYGASNTDKIFFEQLQEQVAITEEITTIEEIIPEKIKPLVVDTLLRNDSLLPKIWTVIVGISKYNHVESLNYSDDDAYRIYAFFKSPEGGALPDNQIQILIDESATKANIVKSLKKTFDNASCNDVIIFYFSGHGIKDAFLPYDYDGTWNAILHSEIIEALKNSPAKHKLCIADACHSGSIDKKFRTNKGNINKLYHAFITSGGGLAVMMSSKAEEISIEYSGLRQGVFSFYLIKGLKGEADTNKNGIITIKEIFSFIQSNVRKYTKNRQNPVLSGGYDVNMPVGIVR